MARVVHHKDAIITYHENGTLSKQYESDESFHAEARGLEIVHGLPSIIKVHNIDLDTKTIIYEVGEKLMDIIDADTLRPVLILASNIIDSLHNADIAHGDFWIGNLLVNLQGPVSTHGCLRLIDFETTVRTTDVEKKGKDLIDFLEYLLGYDTLQDEGSQSLLRTLIDNVRTTETTQVLFMGRMRTRTRNRIKTGIIGQFHDLVLTV